MSDIHAYFGTFGICSHISNVLETADSTSWLDEPTSVEHTHNSLSVSHASEVRTLVRFARSCINACSVQMFLSMNYMSVFDNPMAPSQENDFTKVSISLPEDIGVF